jgi:hypothetical protein
MFDRERYSNKKELKKLKLEEVVNTSRLNLTGEEVTVRTTDSNPNTPNLNA